MKSDLEILKEARGILSHNYIPYHRHLGDGVCALGALENAANINQIEKNKPSLVVAVSDSGRRLFHEKLKHYSYGFLTPEHTVAAVNNHLGKDAILSAFDDAIQHLELNQLFDDAIQHQLELNQLCEAEAQKIECPGGETERVPEAVAAV